jgi:hypothetical protein
MRHADSNIARPTARASHIRTHNSDLSVRPSASVSIVVMMMAMVVIYIVDVYRGYPAPAAASSPTSNNNPLHGSCTLPASASAPATEASTPASTPVAPNNHGGCAAPAAGATPVSVSATTRIASNGRLSDHGCGLRRRAMRTGADGADSVD